VAVAVGLFLFAHAHSCHFNFFPSPIGRSKDRKKVREEKERGMDKDENAIYSFFSLPKRHLRWLLLKASLMKQGDLYID